MLTSIRSACAVVLLLSLFSVTLPGSPLLEEDGMYAIFRTSEGEFIAELYYQQVPMTVANFVGLAEGSRPWLDLNTGSVRTKPFYNGLLFHRVIAGFMIQTGSRNGLGTDGPGYAFADEFANGLHHNTAGILSMANSGVATNGAQFFVTVAPADWLDLKHSVFGRVIEGLANAVTISEYDADGNERPLVDVVLHEVEIVRVGEAAEAFGVNAYGLPAVRGVPATLGFTADDLLLGFPQQRYHQYFVYASENLATWGIGVDEFEFIYDETEADSIDVTALKANTDRLFFNVASVDYGFIPDDFVGLIGKRLTLNFVNDATVVVLDIVAAPTADPNVDGFPGTGTLNGGTPGDLYYFWYQADRVGQLDFQVLEVTNRIIAILHFVDDESGTFYAFVHGNPVPPFPFYGTFLLEDS